MDRKTILRICVLPLTGLSLHVMQKIIGDVWSSLVFWSQSPSAEADGGSNKHWNVANRVSWGTGQAREPSYPRAAMLEYYRSNWEQADALANEASNSFFGVRAMLRASLCPYYSRQWERCYEISMQTLSISLMNVFACWKNSVYLASGRSPPDSRL